MSVVVLAGGRATGIAARLGGQVHRYAASTGLACYGRRGAVGCDVKRGQALARSLSRSLERLLAGSSV
jgi:hypothetical protein